MLDEVFRAKFACKEQMVQEMRKPPRGRLGVEDRTHRKENVEDGLSSSDVSRTRWTHEENKDKDLYISL